jgi:hypothetical protein
MNELIKDKLSKLVDSSINLLGVPFILLFCGKFRKAKKYSERPINTRRPKHAMCSLGGEPRGRERAKSQCLKF